jgi:hypothetical protein
LNEEKLDLLVDGTIPGILDDYRGSIVWDNERSDGANWILWQFLSVRSRNMAPWDPFQPQATLLTLRNGVHRECASVPAAELKLDLNAFEARCQVARWAGRQVGCRIATTPPVLYAPMTRGLPWTIGWPPDQHFYLDWPEMLELSSDPRPTLADGSPTNAAIGWKLVAERFDSRKRNRR